MRILLLGSTGFLGKEILQMIDIESNHVLCVGRHKEVVQSSRYLSTENPRYLNEIADFQPDVVINAMAAWGKDRNELELASGNLIHPLEIITTLETSIYKWIQCNSYFNYWYERNGYDRDLYSMYKRHFTEIASNHANETNSILIDVRLAHLVGANQNNNQIIPRMINAISQGIPLQMSSGKQFLPLIHVSDAAAKICSLIDSSLVTQHKVNKYWRCHTAPVAQLSLKTIANKLEDLMGVEGRFYFDSALDRTTEDYVPVVFESDPITHNSLSMNEIDAVFRDCISGQKTINDYI